MLYQEQIMGGAGKLNKKRVHSKWKPKLCEEHLYVTIGGQQGMRTSHVIWQERWLIIGKKISLESRG